MSSTTTDAPASGILSTVLAKLESVGEVILTDAEQIIVDLFKGVVLPAAAQEAAIVVQAAAENPTNTGLITQAIAAGQANVIQSAEQNGIPMLANEAVQVFADALKAASPVPVTSAAVAAAAPPASAATGS